jgi:hypothetical protein
MCNQEADIVSTIHDEHAAGHLIADCTALEYILLGDLRDLLEEPPDRHTTKWLMAVLDELLATLPRELRLRQRGGYLTEVLEQYPSWHVHVERLRQEKHALYGKLLAMRQLLDQHASLAEIAGTVRRDLRAWMASFAAHHRHERRLVQEAFTLEVGVGD